MWMAIYRGCLSQGFTPIQAFLLLQTQILSGCSSGINGMSEKAPDVDLDDTDEKDDDET